MSLPDPNCRYPVTVPDGSTHPGTVFLSRVIDHPAFEVGDYTYASDFDPPTDWATHLAPYLFASSREKLCIGRYCQIAHGVRFITSSANHAIGGLTTFPFPIFDPAQMADYQPDRRDTIIGHDVWLGYNALVLPGAQIGNGVIIGAGAVVRGNIPDYAVVTGNPAEPIRFRFSQPDIARLLHLQWWNWPPENIARAIPALMAGDITTLELTAP